MSERFAWTKEPCRYCGEPVGLSGVDHFIGSTGELWYSCFNCSRLGETVGTARDRINEKREELRKAEEHLAKMERHQSGANAEALQETLARLRGEAELQDPLPGGYAQKAEEE